MRKPLILWLSAAISIPSAAQQAPPNDTPSVRQKLLDEVVVNGYSTATRRQYTGAAAFIPGEQIAVQPTASFDQALQGRASGLFSVASSGQPGAPAKVIIRGQAGSLTSPLYVVDGIAVESGAFMTMNPADFATVSVLKDANATALYGARGANGVILITTRRGARGPVKFSFNTRHGYSQPTRDRFDMMNTAERLQFEEEIGLETGGRTIGAGWRFSPKNLATNAQFSPARKAAILDSLRHIDIDWRDYFLRNRSPFHEYELNASGGNEQIRFYASANYFRQEGIALRSGIERYSFRNNLDVTAGKFTAAINMYVGYSDNDYIEAEGSTGVANTLASVYYALPYEQPYVNGQLMHSGNKDKLGGAFDTREGSDALERMQSSSYTVNQLKGLINTSLRYQLAEHFFASANIGIDYRENVDTRTIRPGTWSGSAASIPGRQGMHREEMARYYQFTAISGLNYARQFNGRHQVSASLLYEFNRQKTSNMQVTGYGITPGLSGTLSGATQGSAINGFIPQFGGGRTGMAMASLIGTALYQLDEKFTVNLSYRRDGSSMVPEVNRWKNFYSAGLGYDLAKENFLQSAGWLNTLRIRSSYGSSASPFKGNFSYVAGYGSSRYDGTPAIIPVSPGNEQFDWEYTKIFDAGLDVALLDQRVRLVMDWYNRRTEGIFIEEQLSQTSGFATRFNNAGTVRNRGLEIDLSGELMRRNGFSWSAGFNVTWNHNKILSLGQVQEFTQGTNLFRVGMPLNTHYVVKSAGVDTKTGKPLFYNRDGSVTNVFNVAQSVAEFGTSDPRYFGGFFTKASWKGISADVFFTYAQDLYRYNSEEVYTLNSGGFAASNQSRIWLNRWKQEGDAAAQPKFSEPFAFTSAQIHNASFVRLRNAQISWSLPSAWMKATKTLQSATVYVQGQNLLTFSDWPGFDPEDTNNTALFEYPVARTITVGARLQF
ncbi:SusC/RagA family TonB-linked outer membrane protein [Chitinophaga lutea]